MMSAELQLDALHRAYREWAGEPFSVSTFRNQTGPIDAFHALDVLCYRTADEDRLDPGSAFTFFATAGLSVQGSQDDEERVELIWRVTGRRSWPEIQALAQALATIAALPLYGSAIFVPGAIIRNISLPVFDRMDSLIVTHWGVHSPEYLPRIDPPVLLLEIKALFPNEALLAECVGEREICQRLLLESLDWNDPTRPAAGFGGQAQ